MFDSKAEYKKTKKLDRQIPVFFLGLVLVVLILTGVVYGQAAFMVTFRRMLNGCLCMGMMLLVNYFGYRLFDFITPFVTETELRNGNVAVGVCLGLIQLGVMFSFGLVLAGAMF